MICVAIIAFVVLVAFSFIFIAYMCHDKRKFNSIDKYNTLAMDKSKTYNEIKKDYDTNLKKSGVDLDKKSKLKTFYKIVKFFKRDSK